MKILIAILLGFVGPLSVHAQQANDSADSADVSAAQAAVQNVQRAAQKVQAKTPDPGALREATYQQHMRDLDAQSKTDAEVATETFFDKIKDPSPFDGEGKVEDPDIAGAFLDASTPSYTAGPSKDQVPTLGAKGQQDLENQLNQWSDAQQELQQSVQAVSDIAAKNATKPLQLKPQPSGPQLKPAPHCPGTVCVAP